jgi:tRNA1Val (adenine37-N6)-methyltransferase
LFHGLGLFFQKYEKHYKHSKWIQRASFGDSNKFSIFVSHSLPIMKDKPFRFKQFSIAQDRSCLKVGTDAVLLGALVDVSESKRILDIGTGTGVIAIMLAQKSEAFIDAIDIDSPSCDQARDNARNSPWPNRIQIIHKALQEFALESNTLYDTIVSNPPYFEEQAGANTDARTIARHTCELSHSDLLDGIAKLMHQDGTCWLILPAQEEFVFNDLAQKKGLYCISCVNIVTREGKPAKRIVLSIRKKEAPLMRANLVIQLNQSHFTPEYIKLTEDFYLGLK